MSREFLNRNHQQNSDNDNSAENQRKIDPEAQLNWLNNQQVDQGWGLPAQMLAREEEQQTEPEIQMKQSSSLSNDIQSVMQARFGTPVIQRETEEEINENEPESEVEVYIVTNSDAIIRSDTEPHEVSLGNKIPLGTKVIVIDTFNNRSRVQYVNDTNAKHWTTTSNFDKIEPVNDTTLYTAFYNDIVIYSVPKGDATENVLEVDKKYSILNKRKADKNTFYEVKKEGDENAVGWIKDYEYVLNCEGKTDRQDKLKEFKDWLGERLTEAETKTGDEKIKFVQGILGLIEKESKNIAKDDPVYPDIENLDKTPSFSETSNPDLNVAVPHELISITRKFINITELTPVAEVTETEATETTPSATETTESTAAETLTVGSQPLATEDTETGTSETTKIKTVTGGSQHSSYDWNSRFGVPQYRTQSDNLSVPEATCNVTTMAMTLERLGNSRSDVIKAIDTKLKNGEEKTDAQLKTLWEEKSKAYLKKITSYEKSLEADAKAREDAAEISKTEAEEEIKTAEGEALVAANKKLSDANKILNNKRNVSTWRYLRGNKGSLIGKEDELSKIFKENAQMEDLLDFYLYLPKSKVNQRTKIFNDEYKDNIPEQIKNPSYSSTSKGEVKTERIDLNRKKVSYEQRAKIKNALDKGCSVVISVFHKGKDGGSHIISVQSISSEGLILDDPYGGLVDSYRQGETGDFFAGNGKKNRTANKNKVHISSETDYSKRDFTAEAAQNLEDDEARGDTKTLKWEMINESKSLIYYIVIYENN